MTASDKSSEIKPDEDPAANCNFLMKRIFDLAACMLILTLSLILFFLFAILIRLDSKGPVFFIQKRLGKNGVVFNCYKFRTMILNAEEVLKSSLQAQPELRKEWEANYKLKNDPRVTRVGKLLRKTSIDELPQLFNVLKGEMSLVGPRPRALYEMSGMTDDALFSIGLSVLPGVTGLWQVSGRNELDFYNRILLDAVYVRTWSFSKDILLLLKTVSIVLRQKGAY